MKRDSVLFEAGYAWGAVTRPDRLGNTVVGVKPLEDDLWSAVLEKFIARTADAISFRGVASEKDVLALPSFSNWIPGAFIVTWYCPQDAPTDARRPLDVKLCDERIAVIELTPDVMNRIRRHAFGQWTQRDVTFYRRDKELLRVTPPKVIRFLGLSRELLALFFAADARIEARSHGPLHPELPKRPRPEPPERPELPPYLHRLEGGGEGD